MSVPVHSEPPPTRPPCQAEAAGRGVRPGPELRLTAALRELLAEARAHGLTLGAIIDRVEERAFGVLMAFLCLPFLLPVTIPGSSTPFGLILMALGVQLALGRKKPWLPARLRAWSTPRAVTEKVLSGVARLFKPLERLVRPRLLFMQNRPMLILVGVAITIDAFFLALPWPPVIPLSNTIPAWLAFIKVLGLTEEDGLAMLLGVVFTFGALLAGIATLVVGWMMYTDRR